MSRLDLTVLLSYVGGVVVLGSWLNRRSRQSEQFMAASRSLPGWAVGLSILGTFLSSTTFLGNPGKTYAGNWNLFVFSLSIPLAAWVAARWFVPFYRQGGQISAYHHLESRFGPWARQYAVLCYLLTQTARVAIILVGVSLALQALLGVPAEQIILMTGVLVTVYTVLGGIEAVIWTDVVQCVVLLVGALWVLVTLPMLIPGGWTQAIYEPWEQGKFSLGSLGADLTSSTFWVVLIYGVFINLGNFGIDQNYVQRYLTAKSDTDARQSLWLGAWLYLPVSMLFCLIGTWLYVYYESEGPHREQLHAYVASLQNPSAGDRSTDAVSLTTLSPADVGDRAFPFFIVSALPIGVRGLLIAALLAAAMSSIDSSLNSAATITLCDLFSRRNSGELEERSKMRILHRATMFWGATGTAVALFLVDSKSILDTWWKLQGVLSGGVLGLFLLGMLSRRTRSADAAVGVCVGIIALAWLTLSKFLPESDPWHNRLHDNLTIVVGTTLIVATGGILSRKRTRIPHETSESPQVKQLQ